MADQVELNGLGYVVIEWDEEDDEGKVKTRKVRWRRPKLRQYREARNLFRELGNTTQTLREEMADVLEALQYDQTGSGPDGYVLPDDFDKPEWMEKLNDIRDQLADYTIPWVAAVDQMLAMGKGLPDDPDDWPAWLATATFPSQVIEHWRNVPLAPGKSGTNNPSQS